MRKYRPIIVLFVLLIPVLLASCAMRYKAVDGRMKATNRADPWVVAAVQNYEQADTADGICRSQFTEFNAGRLNSVDCWLGTNHVCGCRAPAVCNCGAYGYTGGFGYGQTIPVVTDTTVANFGAMQYQIGQLEGQNAQLTAGMQELAGVLQEVIGGEGK